MRSRLSREMTEAVISAKSVAPGLLSVPTEFGNGLVSVSSWAAGEIVLTEQPLHMLPDGPPESVEALAATCAAMQTNPENAMCQHIASVLNLYVSCDVARRRAMLAIFHKPDDEGLEPGEIGLVGFLENVVHRVQAAWAPAAACEAIDLVHAITTWLLSSHDCGGGSAVFTVGSLANHSCDPNVVFHTNNTGALVYRAIRPIKAGEPILLSYLHSHELLLPSASRRQLLSARKRFTCQCERCRGGGDEVGATDAVLQMWSDGVDALRSGVLSGDKCLAQRGMSLLTSYFSWCESNFPGKRHFVSSQIAETFACLVAMRDDDASHLAVKLCAPYLISLENEYGVEDAHNQSMRATVRALVQRSVERARSQGQGTRTTSR